MELAAKSRNGAPPYLLIFAIPMGSALGGPAAIRALSRQVMSI
jgi:hypothetical protein